MSILYESLGRWQTAYNQFALGQLMSWVNSSYLAKYVLNYLEFQLQHMQAVEAAER